MDPTLEALWYRGIRGIVDGDRYIGGCIIEEGADRVGEWWGVQLISPLESDGTCLL